VETTEHLSTEPTMKLQEGVQVELCKGLTMRVAKFGKSQSTTLSKQALLLVKAGSFSVSSTKQTFQAEECLYTRRGCGQVDFCEDSAIFVLEWNEK
jgi:hypothetical protein